MSRFPPMFACAVFLACGSHAHGGDAVTGGDDASADDGGAGDDSPTQGDDGSPAADAGPGPRVLWSKEMGDGAFEDVTALAVDAAGNVTLTGYFQGTVDFGGGPLTCAGGNDMFVAKYDATGKHLWSKRFGDAADQLPWGLAVDDAGDVAIVGAFAGALDTCATPLMGPTGTLDAFVARLDPNGNGVWCKDLKSDTNSDAYGVAIDTTGAVAIIGDFEGTVDLGKGPLTSAGMYDGFVAMFDQTGALTWGHRFGDAADQHGVAIAFAGGGNLAFTANFEGTVDLGAGPLVSAGKNDMLVAKLDVRGAPLWNKRYGDANNQVTHAVRVDASGNVVWSGGFEGMVDFGAGGPLSAGAPPSQAVVKLDPSGKTLWAKGFGHAGVFDWTSLALDRAGGVVVAGEFMNAIDFGAGAINAVGAYDLYAASFDGAGALRWAKGWGYDSSKQLGRAVAVDGMGDVLAGGSYQGKLIFGPGMGKPGVGQGLLFVVKLAPP